MDFTHRNAATAHSASGEVQAGGVQILGTAATCHNEIPTHTHSGIIRQPYSMNSGDDILRGNDAGKQTVRVQRIDAERTAPETIKIFQGTQESVDRTTETKTILRNRTINDAKMPFPPEAFQAAAEKQRDASLLRPWSAVKRMGAAWQTR